jgi:hypothetical protein
MQELIGQCDVCKKELYCMDGFFQGEMDSTGKLFCYSCYIEEKKESDEK